jgi:hypothetical protein
MHSLSFLGELVLELLKLSNKPEGGRTPHLLEERLSARMKLAE